MALSGICLPPFISKHSLLTSTVRIPSPRRAFSTISAVNSIKPSSLKSRLTSGEKLQGLILFTASPTLAEIAALAGYDFIVVDLEHGPGDVSVALACLRAIQAGGSSTVVRVPETTPSYAKKVLDLGPEGIMFPKVETRKDAADAVSMCRYPPKGTRGCAYSLVRDSMFGFEENYLAEYDENLLIMGQVETQKGVTNIQDIIGVEGMDCVTTGPRDLSASLGLLHDPGNEKVKEELLKLERAVKQSDPANGGAFLAGMATPKDTAIKLKKRGYDIVLGASDISLFTKATIQNVNAFKA